VALGRKTFFFAGSHDAARRIATLHSLMRTCAQHDVRATALRHRIPASSQAPGHMNASTSFYPTAGTRCTPHDVAPVPTEVTVARGSPLLHGPMGSRNGYHGVHGGN